MIAAVDVAIADELALSLAMSLLPVLSLWTLQWPTEELCNWAPMKRLPVVRCRPLAAGPNYCSHTTGVADLRVGGDYVTVVAVGSDAAVDCDNVEHYDVGCDDYAGPADTDYIMFVVAGNSRDLVRGGRADVGSGAEFDERVSSAAGVAAIDVDVADLHSYDGLCRDDYDCADYYELLDCPSPEYYYYGCCYYYRNRWLYCDHDAGVDCCEIVVAVVDDAADVVVAADSVAYPNVGYCLIDGGDVDDGQSDWLRQHQRRLVARRQSSWS